MDQRPASHASASGLAPAGAAKTAWGAAPTGLTTPGWERVWWTDCLAGFASGRCLVSVTGLGWGEDLHDKATRRQAWPGAM